MNGYALNIEKNKLIIGASIAALGLSLAILGANFSFLLAFLILASVLMTVSIFIKPETGLYFIAAVIPIGRFTVPGLPFNVTIADGLIIVALFSWIIRKLVYEKKYMLAKDKLFILLAVFTILSGLSLYNCRDKLRGTIEFIQTVEYFIIIPYLFFDLIKNTKQIKGILWTMLIASTFFAPWGIFEAVAKGIRSVSISGHANAFGAYLAMIIPVAYILLLGERRPPRKLFLIGLLCILGFALMGTLSRSSWLAIATAGLVINFKKGLKKTATISIFVLVLIGVLVSFYIPDMVSSRIETLTKLQVETTGERPRQVVNAWNMIKSHPFLGVGLNETPRYNPFQHARGEIHNFFLQIGAERGLFALTALLVFFILYLRRLNRLTNLKLGLLSNYALIFFAISIAFLVAGLSGYPVGRGNANVFMMFVGISIALYSLANKELQEEI